MSFRGQPRASREFRAAVADEGGVASVDPQDEA